MTTFFAIVVLIAVVAAPAGFVAHKTNQAKKRGCGRGCATCRNFEVCHGKKQLGYTPADHAPDSVAPPSTRTQ